MAGKGSEEMTMTFHKAKGFAKNRVINKSTAYEAAIETMSRDDYYGHRGELEQMRDKISQTQEFCAKLFEMVTSGKITPQAASECLGAGFFAMAGDDE